MKTKVIINVSGNNIRRFISKLINIKIEILNIEYLSSREANIEIYNNDLKKVKSLKSIYEIKIKEYKGYLRLKRLFRKNIIFVASLFLGFILIIFLSNVIFKVEVVHNDNKLRTILYEELSNYDIKKYKLKKDYDDIQIIKSEILKKYKDKIEWLEIIEDGTEYIVRVEERKIINNSEEVKPRNIIAKCDAVIKKILATNGQVVKEVNNYVKKGDIIISGNVYLNDLIKDTVRANGSVYGEVWYQVSIEYPFNYQEEKLTGNEKDIYVIKLFNHVIGLNQYKNKITEDKLLYKNNYFPLSIIKQKQRETNIIDEVYTIDEVIDKALELGRSKINAKLGESEFIITEKKLKLNIKNSKIVLDMFYSTYENITDYEEIG